MNAHRMAQILGRRGGQARARRLSAAERRRIAALGGHARRRSLEAARRLVSTLEYAAAVRELRGDSPDVRAIRTCGGPLPDIRGVRRRHDGHPGSR